MNSIQTSFTRLSSQDFLSQVQRIVTAMTGNANFPEPWPATVPTLAQIQTDLAAFQSALNATSSGDRTRIVPRNTARSKLGEDLAQLGCYVQLTAQNDADMLATSGFPLRQRAPRTQNPMVPAAPAVFRLDRGPISGSIVLRASRVSMAGSYDVQVTTGDPTVESNWIDAGSYKNCRRIELTGLTPMKTYSVRIRALGAAGFGAWTPAVSMPVV
jgi:hypothetical protein